MNQHHEDDCPAETYGGPCTCIVENVRIPRSDAEWYANEETRRKLQMWAGRISALNLIHLRPGDLSLEVKQMVEEIRRLEGPGVNTNEPR